MYQNYKRFKQTIKVSG